MNAYSTISVHRKIYDEKLCFKTYARLFRRYSLRTGLLIWMKRNSSILNLKKPLDLVVVITGYGKEKQPLHLVVPCGVVLLCPFTG